MKLERLQCSRDFRLIGKIKKSYPDKYDGKNDTH